MKVSQNVAGSIQSAFLAADMLTSSHTLGYLTAFFLCQCSHEGEAKLTVTIHGPDVIFYEENFNDHQEIFTLQQVAEMSLSVVGGGVEKYTS